MSFLYIGGSPTYLRGFTPRFRVSKGWLLLLVLALLLMFLPAATGEEPADCGGLPAGEADCCCSCERVSKRTGDAAGADDAASEAVAREGA